MSGNEIPVMSLGLVLCKLVFLYTSRKVSISRRISVGLKPLGTREILHAYFSQEPVTL